MTDCIRGCARRDRHKPDCTRGDACPGCEPRSATHGRLCTPCHYRLAEWLGDGENSITAALGHLTDKLAGRVKAQALSDGPQRHEDDGLPVPLALDVYDCRQLLMDRLFIADERVRDEFNRPTPDEPFDPAVSCAFLSAWLTKIEDDYPADGLIEMWDRFAESMSAAHALAPWRAQVRRRKGIPCPHCERQALVVYGGEDVVTCQSCGEIYDRTTYDRWTALLSYEREHSGELVHSTESA